MFLQRHRFPGRAVLIAMLTFPLAFPGVVVGFLIILLAGRQGLIGDVTSRLFGEKLVFAYSIYGLFLGYLYFSIPRVILTIMAAVQKLDVGLEEAARSLGASPWAVQRDVVLPALGPAFVASGAIAFATAMGAFGTAFTLATNIDVLPMLIYTEFTLAANFATSAALSVGLGHHRLGHPGAGPLVQRRHRRGGRMKPMRDRLIFAGQLICSRCWSPRSWSCPRSCRSPPASP